MEWGKLHGKTHVERENNYALDAVYEHGKLVGPATVRFFNGDKYTGEWGAHGADGEGTMTYATGGSYTGGWKDGNWQGSGMIAYANGIRREPPSRLPVAQGAPATPPRQHRLLHDVNSVRRLDSQAHGASVPFNKGYADLSPDEQRIVREWFKILHDDDVPPYPLHGPAEITKAISTIHGHLDNPGILDMDVLVDEQGTPQSVVVRRAPDKEVADIAGKVLLLTKYTPARCAGKPCAMSFPFHFDLQ